MPELSLLLFSGLLVFAAVHDVATMRIPNWVSIAIVAAFPVAGWAAGVSWSDIGFGLLIGAITLGVCFIMFQFNAMGGGDAKLIAACCVWLGGVGMVMFVPWMTIAGGLLALTLVLMRHFVPNKETYPAFFSRLLSRKKGAPYGVAIAAGALVALPFSPIAIAIAAP
jgi:prepilin peptidase CpaA